MKKSIVAASASAVALAAMPAVGVFAVQTSAGSTTDTVEVTIENACTMTATGNEDAFAKVMTNGQSAINIGSTIMNIKCNNAAGWDLKAVGSGAGADNTAMHASGSGTDIITGTAQTGPTSNWAMKVRGANVLSEDYTVVPGAETTVARSLGATNTVDGVEVSTFYAVYISPTQQADTYTGKVTYTLYQPHE